MSEGGPQGMNRRIDKAVQKEPIQIAAEPLLRALFDKAKETGSPEEVESEHEIERRYLPARPLTPEELSPYAIRDIDQVYLIAQDLEGGTHEFRLRRTFREGKEGVLLRVALKMPTDHPSARNEHQIKFSPEDDRASGFEKLWEKHGWRPLSKTRYYIPHTLPNGHECEIHYDVHRGEFKGLIKVEIEFQRKEDEQLVLENPTVVPGWIGQDITSDKRYSSRSLAKQGMPQ